MRKREEHAARRSKARDNSVFDRGSWPFGAACSGAPALVEVRSPLDCATVGFQLPSALESAVAKFRPASSLESAVARLKDLKSPRMNRYRKMGDGGGGGHLQTGVPSRMEVPQSRLLARRPFLTQVSRLDEIQGAGCACAQKTEVTPCRGWRTKLLW